jgi:DNA-directed RNA polymerase alpha subunit
VAISDDTLLDTLGLSVRALNTAASAGATTVGQLRALTEEQVVARKGFAATALDELRAKLAEFGLRFRESLR